MKRRATLLFTALIAACLLGGDFASTAAAGPYGRTGLGSNLHRRFVIKQARKNASLGRPVRRSAILWRSQPQLNRPVVYYYSYGW